MRFTTATLILLWPLWLYAAQSPSGQLTGTVEGPDGPVADAVVTLARGAHTRETRTDAQGRYGFASLALGEYRLTVSTAGLQAGQDIVISSATPVQVPVMLLPAFAETAVVTASRDRELLGDVPASMSVVGQREIELSASDGVPGLLQGVPGLNVTQFGARDFNINARDSAGRLSNSMLVMIDGRPLNQSFYGAVFWDLMTVSKYELAQIEVVRTPASALWGANALSGAINIRTKRPRDMLGLHGYFGAGELGSVSAGVTWADATPALSYKLSASYIQHDAYPRDNTLPDGSPMPASAQFENRGTRQPKFDARIDWKEDGDRLWSVRGGLSGAYGLIHSALGPGEFADGSYAGYLEAHRQGSNYDFKVYWNRLYWPFRIVLFGLDETASNDTYAAEATRQFNPHPRHRLTTGGSIKLDRFDISVAPSDRQRFDGAAFVEDKILLGDHVTAIAGARVDKFDTTGAVFSPRVGVVVAPTPAHTFRAAYNRAYRAPSLLENFAYVSLPAVLPLPEPFLYFQTAQGSTDLDMESHDAFEVGYTGALNRRTVVFATVYDQKAHDKIWFVPVGFYGPANPPPGWPADPALAPFVPSTFSFVNSGNVRERGVELAARLDLTDVALRGSYTFQATPTLTDNTTPYPLEINRPSKNRFSVGGTYAHGQWALSSDLSYTGRAFWADVLTQPFWGYTDSFVNVDAQVRYRLRARSWEFWTSATNLLDSEIKAHVYGDTISRRVMVGLDWRYR